MLGGVVVVGSEELMLVGWINGSLGRFPVYDFTEGMYE